MLMKRQDQKVEDTWELVKESESISKTHVESF